MENFYRIKTEWLAELEDKSLAKAKTEELVRAVNYTDAEKLAYALVEKYDRAKFGSVSIEIIKTKISEIICTPSLETEEETTAGLMCSFFSDASTTEVGLYQVKVVYTNVDEKSGKVKYSSEDIYVPAESSADAVGLLNNYLQKMGEMRDYVVRRVSFDKVEAIYWSPEYYQKIVKFSE